MTSKNKILILVISAILIAAGLYESLIIKKVSFKDSIDASLELEIEKIILSKKMLFPFLDRSIFSELSIKSVDYTFTIPNHIIISYEKYYPIAYFQDQLLLENGTLSKKAGRYDNTLAIINVNNSIKNNDKFAMIYVSIYDCLRRLGVSMSLFQVLADGGFVVRTNVFEAVFGKNFDASMLDQMEKIIKKYEKNIEKMDFRYANGVAVSLRDE